MSSPAPFASIAELLERSLAIRHVYGEPVHHGDKTIIPVATVAYAFGAGGGRGSRRWRHNGPDGETAGRAGAGPEGQGAGGGGAVRMTPAGVLEVTAASTRFVRFPGIAPMVAAGVFGAAIGWLIARRTRILS